LAILLKRRARKGASGGSTVDIRRAVGATLELEGVHDREVSVLLTDDREIRRLNRTYRGIDRPTDVLAFAFDEADGPGGDGGPLGDVIISVERARAQARQRGVKLESELELLAVHGTLHLLGYDHREPEEAQKMRKKTRAVRRRIRRPAHAPTKPGKTR
jgi:probable rRNA maturation factor